MAIQFPPVNFGDPEPENGDTYLYLPTQSEFMCFRRSSIEAAQWSEKGTISTTSFGYRGGLEITSPPPTDANKGNIYSVVDGGVASLGFTGLYGTEVEQWSLIIFSEPEWVLINTGYIPNTPWVRTANGTIMPVVETDNLDMDQGNYLINELPEL